MSELVTTADGTNEPTLPVRDTGRVIAQVSKVWPKSGAWPTDMTKYLDPISAEEAWSPAMGSATIQQPFGVIRQPDAPRFLNFGSYPSLGRSSPTESLSGRYVRLCKSTPGGSVGFDGGSYEPFWWGVVGDVTLEEDGAEDNKMGGVARWECAGLGYLLEKVRPTRGHELNADAAVIDPGGLLVFNECGVGNRSSLSSYSVTYPNTSWVFDRRGSGERWNALQVATYLLKAFGAHENSALRWSIDGQTAALEYCETWDFRGLTVWQALTRLINPRRGVGFQVRVVAGQPVVYVTTGFADNGSVGDLDIQANENKSALTIAGDLWKDSVQIAEREGPVYDEIILEGAPHLVCATLYYKGDGTGEIVKGWDTALEASWTSSTKDPKYEQVWRRFKIRDGWDWDVTDSNSPVYQTRGRFPHSGAYGAETSANKATFGEGGLTAGGFATTTPAPAWPVQALRFERLLPVYEGYSYPDIMPSGTDTLPTTVDKSRPFLPPMVFLSTDSGSTWSDISANYTLRMEDKAAAIMLGNGITEAAEIKGSIDSSSARLAFTVAFYTPLVLAVSWRRPRAQWPRDYPRVLRLTTKDARFWEILNATALGINGTSLKKIAGSRKTVADDRDDLRSILRLCLPWYSQPDLVVSWSEEGDVDTSSARRPGSMVSDLVLGDRTLEVNGVVSRRRWQLTDDEWRTSYIIERIKPDLEGLL